MLPNLIVIGAMKCGTTSLHHYLDLHPEIRMAREKELNFFLREGTWQRGVAWYASRFQGRAAVHGESSPSYSHHPFFAGVPERMASLLPDAKLIYLVREPVERVVSHYLHEVVAGNERRPLAAALDDLERSPYVWASRYATQVERYLEHYPPERILVVAQEELLASRLETLAGIFSFLGVDPTFRCAGFATVKHRSSDKRRATPAGERLLAASTRLGLGRLPDHLRRRVERLLVRPFSHPVERPVLPPALRARLTTFLAPEAARIQQMAGRSFPGWDAAAEAALRAAS